MTRRIPLVLLLALSLGACSDPSGTLTAGDDTLVTARRPKTPTGEKLVKCASTESQSVTGTILPLVGGLVSAAGTSISVPSGALLAPTVIRVTVPASPFMEIDVSAVDIAHLLFQTPATITLDYSRCPADAVEAPLSVWYIDSATREPLENMHGVDDRVNHRITFTTGHLSGYAIAN